MTSPPSRLARIAPRLAPLGLLAAAGIYLLWEIAHRGVYLYNTAIYQQDPADEWRYTACSRLVAHGYALFSQVFSAQPPLLFLSLATGTRLGGDSILGARWVEILFGLLGLCCAAWIAGSLGGRYAAAVASLLLAVSPGFLLYSHAVEAEGPMAALVALSLALTVQYRRDRRALWLIGGGFVLALAVLMKLFAAETIAPAAWMVVADPQKTRARARALATYAVAAAVPLALDFGLVSPSQQWRQVITLHNRAAAIHLRSVTPAAEILGHYLTLDLGLTLLAGMSLVILTATHYYRDETFFALWLLGTIVMLLLFHPLFPHHAAILSIPLAVTAGCGISPVVKGVGDRRFTLLLAGLGALLYVALIPRLAHADRHLLISAPPASSNPLVTYIVRHSRPGDFIGADDLQLADEAHRLVPPPLCDPSNVRLRAGYLTSSDLISATRRYQPKLVVSSFGIFQQVPAYLRWLGSHYRSGHAFGASVYSRR